MRSPIRSFLSLSFVMAGGLAWAAPVEVPTLERLLSKAGVPDQHWISRPVKAKLDRKLKDAADAGTEKRAKDLIGEAEQEAKKIARVCQAYMACSEAIESGETPAKSSACSSATLESMEPVIRPPLLQELKRKLGLEELPGGSCNEDERFACTLKCAPLLICPCCQD